MLVAVVPARNEEKRIIKAIETLLTTPLDLVIPVINGSTDNSLAIIRQIQSPRILPIFFVESLGIDVPRAVGAKIACDRGADAILFLDGDMEGNISKNLCELIDSVIFRHYDMSLTNCYPDVNQAGLSTLASHLLEERRRLNRELGLEKKIGAASPSHGPHIVSRRFLNTIPLRELAIPPVSLALAARYDLRVNIGTTIGHKYLGSQEKDQNHSRLIAETIIGDCIEALSVFRNEKRSRIRKGIEYTGYHPERRFDILDRFISTII